MRRTRCSGRAAAGSACSGPRSTRCRCARSSGRQSRCATHRRAPRVEIMHPLVGFAEGAAPAARAHGQGGVGGGMRPPVPRRDDDRAASLLSPGRRDHKSRRLLLVRHQRPHADRARVLARRRRGEVPRPYLEGGVLAHDPFATLDRDGVGELMRLAVDRGRLQTARPASRLASAESTAATRRR